MSRLSHAALRGGNSYDVVVVGAGIAGLTAAYRILQQRPQMRLLLLEQGTRLGGRVRTLYEPVKMELGAAVLSVDIHKHLLPLMHELGFRKQDFVASKGQKQYALRRPFRSSEPSDLNAQTQFYQLSLVEKGLMRMAGQ